MSQHGLLVIVGYIQLEEARVGRGQSRRPRLASYGDLHLGPQTAAHDKQQKHDKQNEQKKYMTRRTRKRTPYVKQANKQRTEHEQITTDKTNKNQNTKSQKRTDRPKNEKGEMSSSGRPVISMEREGTAPHCATFAPHCATFASHRAASYLASRLRWERRRSADENQESSERVFW